MRKWAPKVAQITNILAPLFLFSLRQMRFLAIRGEIVEKFSVLFQNFLLIRGRQIFRFASPVLIHAVLLLMNRIAFNADTYCKIIKFNAKFGDHSNHSKCKFELETLKNVLPNVYCNKNSSIKGVPYQKCQFQS